MAEWENKPIDIGTEATSIILVSPDGTEYKLVVDNNGIFSTEEVA